jgi:hypothetical protein
MSAPSPSACRAFEDRLAERLDASGAPLPVGEPHVASCSGCADLVATLGENAATFCALSTPQPSADFFARLVSLPTDLTERNEAARVLEYLRPGALLAPEPSPGLLSRLAFLPARARAARHDRAPAPGRAFLRRLVGDWRFSVVLAYAAALLAVVLLGVDPLTTARDAASDLTASGERALARARSAAVARIEDTPIARAARPYTERLDYRLYRAVAAGRARAAAYSQLVFEKVFGGALEAPTASSEPPPSSRKEPSHGSLRSLKETRDSACKVTT